MKILYTRTTIKEEFQQSTVKLLDSEYDEWLIAHDEFNKRFVLVGKKGAITDNIIYCRDDGCAFAGTEDALMRYGFSKSTRVEALSIDKKLEYAKHTRAEIGKCWIRAQELRDECIPNYKWSAHNRDEENPSDECMLWEWKDFVGNQWTASGELFRSLVSLKFLSKRNSLAGARAADMFDSHNGHLSICLGHAMTGVHYCEQLAKDIKNEAKNRED